MYAKELRVAKSTVKLKTDHVVNRCTHAQNKLGRAHAHRPHVASRCTHVQA